MKKYWCFYADVSHNFIPSTYINCILWIWTLKVFCFSQHFSTLLFWPKRKQKVGFLFRPFDQLLFFNIVCFFKPTFQKSISIFLGVWLKEDRWENRKGKQKVIIRVRLTNWNWHVSLEINVLIAIFLTSWILF